MEEVLHPERRGSAEGLLLLGRCPEVSSAGGCSGMHCRCRQTPQTCRQRGKAGVTCSCCYHKEKIRYFKEKKILKNFKMPIKMPTFKYSPNHEFSR